LWWGFPSKDCTNFKINNFLEESKVKKLLFIAAVFTVSTVVQIAVAGQTIGQITDPCNPSINGSTDIISAWVERSGTKLTFVMEMRGNIPSAAQLPDYNDTVTYIWLVDADNNPATGQNPGGAGGEFNVRAVISKNPLLAGGYVDIVGALTDPGVGGIGGIATNANRISVTIDRSQIASVRRFHWRSDAWSYIGGQVSNNNGVTESGLARVGRYGVLPLPENNAYWVGENYLRAYLQSDPCNAVIDLTDQNGGTFFVCLPLEWKWPDQDNTKINTQATGHAGPNHLRMATRFDVTPGELGLRGYAEGKATFDGDFMLDGNESEMGLIPHGIFVLKFNHDYRLFASDGIGQGYCTTFAQIVINQIDPPEQKGVWVYQDRMQNEDRFAKNAETIDLADYGLELGVPYEISVLLTDRSEMPQWTTAGSIFTDSTMITLLDVAYIPGDLDSDWDVDFLDFAHFAKNWLTVE
jgi:hypothetical protein